MQVTHFNKIGLIHLIPLFLLLGSCNPIMFPEHKEHIVALDQKNYKLLNGTFSNVDTSGGLNFASAFNWFGRTPFYIDSIDKAKNYAVKVEFISDRKLKLSLIDSHKVIKRDLVIKGHFKKGFFEANKYKRYDEIDWPNYHKYVRAYRFYLTDQKQILIDDYYGYIFHLIGIPMFGSSEHSYFTKFPLIY